VVVIATTSNLPSDGKVLEREKTLDVAKQVLATECPTRILPPDAWAAFVFSAPDACPF
jgi:hypothetical protein